MAQILLTAVALAMDAFAVSVSTGVSVKGHRLGNAAIMGIYFGAFQFIMPLIGWMAGQGLFKYIEGISYFIAFCLLAFIGGKMIFGALKEAGRRNVKQSECVLTLAPTHLIVLAVATSLDALAAGISMAVMDVNILLSAVIIGIVAFVFSFMGGLLGNRLGCLFKTRAEIAGGIILVLIGVKTLMDHFSQL